MLGSLLAGLILGQRHKNVRIDWSAVMFGNLEFRRPKPRRNTVPPPQLAADAPRLDVLHPVEEGLFPALGDDLDIATADLLDRLCRELFRIDIPLVGQPRLDHHAAAVTERRRDLARLGVEFDLLTLLVLLDVRDQVALFLQPLDDELARTVLAIAFESVQAEIFVRHQTVRRLADIRIACQHVEHLRGLDACALADLEIVEVVPRRDLHRARTQFGIGMLVGDDGNTAAGDRRDYMFANDALVALVARVDRHRHVGEHRFGPRGRDDDVILTVVQSDAVRERVFEVPEAPRDRLLLDLEIADRGLQFRVPVHQPLVAVDEAIVVEVDEDLQHGLGEVRVHRKLLARPVHRTAEAAQLVGDLPAAFRFPFPDLLDEFLARVIGALVLALLHLALDHHLRRDPGMVGADDPQRILAAHPLVPDHDVLQRVVERVADMEAARHVGWRVDDSEGFRVRALGPEAAGLFPVLVPSRLDLGGCEGGG